MRTLRRNRQKIFYKNFVNMVPVENEDGMLTGEYEKIYGSPQEIWVNIAPNTGKVAIREFGEHVEYDRIIYTTHTEMTHDSILWVDDLDLEKPHNFIVTAIAPSLNGVTIGIRSVDVR